MDPTCLTDPDVFPDERIIAGHLKRATGLWNAFSRAVNTDPALSLEWQFYRDGKRWLGKVVRKKKVLCWIAVRPGRFAVTFYFGARNDAAVGAATFDPRLKRAYLDRRGKETFRPLTIEVRSKAALRDAGELLRLRAGLN